MSNCRRKNPKFFRQPLSLVFGSFVKFRKREKYFFTLLKWNSLLQKNRKLSDHSRVKPRRNGGTKEKLKKTFPSGFLISFLFVRPLVATLFHPIFAEHKIENDDAWLLVSYTVPNAIHSLWVSFSVSLFLHISLLFFLCRFAASNISNKLAKIKPKEYQEHFCSHCVCSFAHRKTHTEREREWDGKTWWG